MRTCAKGSGVAPDQGAGTPCRRAKEEATPPSPTSDLETYRTQVLGRLAEPALGHTTRQVAADGTEKFPARVVTPLREHLTAGRTPPGLTATIAALTRYVTAAHTDTGAPAPVCPSAIRSRMELA